MTKSFASAVQRLLARMRPLLERLQPLLERMRPLRERMRRVSARLQPQLARLQPQLARLRAFLGRHRKIVGGAVLVVAVAVGAVVVTAPGREQRRKLRRLGERVGTAFAVGVEAAIQGSPLLLEPYRCGFLGHAESPAESAEEPLSGAGLELVRRGWRVDARAAEPPVKADKELVIGVVADARGDVTRLPEIRRFFDSAKVELVVSLGGLGTGEAAIREALTVLATGAPWPLLAIPGDSESIPAHQAAIAAVAKDTGALVLDGMKTRFLTIQGTALVTVPGGANRGQLAADENGCIPDQRTLDLLASALSAHEGARVIASYLPPRQTGAAGSDLAHGGIHVGVPAITDLARTGKADLVVHGMVGDTIQKEQGQLARGDTPAMLAAGAAEGLPHTIADGRVVRGAALVVVVGPRAVRYRRGLSTDRGR